MNAQSECRDRPCINLVSAGPGIENSSSNLYLHPLRGNIAKHARTLPEVQWRKQNSLGHRKQTAPKFNIKMYFRVQVQLGLPTRGTQRTTGVSCRVVSTEEWLEL